MLDSIRKIFGIITRRELFQLALLLVGITFLALSQAIGVASIFPFIALVMEPEMVFDNRYLHFIYSFFNFGSTRAFVIFSGLVMFFIIIVTNTISAVVNWFKIRFAWRNNHRLSKRMLEKYLSMPYAYFLNQNSSDLSKNVLTEVHALTKSYLIPLITVFTKTLIIIFLLVMLFWVDILTTIIALIVLGGLYALIFYRINRNLKARGEKRMEANKMRFKVVSEAFGGIKEIKLMNREIFFIKKFTTHSMKMAHLQSWNSVVTQLPSYALEAIAFGGIILFIMVLMLTHDDARQVIPLAALFAFAGHRIKPAFQEIFGALTTMQFHKAILDRVYADMTGDNSLLPQEVILEELPEILLFSREIKLENVTYNYPGSEIPVISNLNLSIKHKTSIAFVGSTGAGKTTLADIILGLLIPVDGQMLIDDIPVTRDNLVAWQMNIGYVPQHIYLSDDTIANNIAFGLPEKQIDREALDKATAMANIDQFIREELPSGYDTMVGERGVRLSGGQRQRIGIARALYHDPEVIVFDEATSALDGATEGAVLKAMENAARLKTLIIIAHRFNTVKNCDHVFLIERGKISASGTYEELLASNDHFRKMAKIKG